MSVNPQRSKMGNCSFPPAPHGLAQVYDLPIRENVLQSEAHNAYYLDKTNDRFWSLYSMIWNRNKILPKLYDQKAAYNFLIGIASRIPEQDIRFFINIGGGLNRSKSERKAEEKASTLSRKMYGNSLMRWILSPQTVIHHALRFSDECPQFVSKTVKAAKIAIEKRKSGEWESAF